MSVQKFPQKLARFQRTFSRRLEKYFVSQQIGSQKISQQYAELVKSLAYYVGSGGKRLRPYLLNLGYQIAGGRDRIEIRQASLALELFHNFALIHDDIMDGANERRGEPTLHRQLANWHRRSKWRGERERFGIGMAILAGDILLAWADELIGEVNNQAVADLYQKMKNEIMIGQAEDVFLSQIRQIPARARIIQTALLKSARYSIEKPLLMGAALAGQAEKYRRLFISLAEPLGLAFQLQDDILGVFGEKSTVGKSVSSDLKEGKMTLLMYYFLKPGKISPKLLQATWGNQQASSPAIARLKKSLKSSPTLTRVAREITKYLARAEKITNRTKLLTAGEKEIILSLVDFLKRRDY